MARISQCDRAEWTAHPRHVVDNAWAARASLCWRGGGGGTRWDKAIHETTMALAVKKDMEDQAASVNRRPNGILTTSNTPCKVRLFEFPRMSLEVASVPMLPHGE
ncbi:Aste57867_48 [Aphanomyces stellatus]|uniref:Aste57867_48 protein n=1 Tax=Aphanomyces stellatus TaxID=120398 RepID=A0A485K5R1_9STRA|nr:hypothetical protein As57867_000048 [Aphanomyces stellatus]VFT77274.1 Aste57867_48 [Aphanomyces stellatus]